LACRRCAGAHTGGEAVEKCSASSTASRPRSRSAHGHGQDAEAEQEIAAKLAAANHLLEIDIADATMRRSRWRLTRADPPVGCDPAGNAATRLARAGVIASTSSSSSVRPRPRHQAQLAFLASGDARARGEQFAFEQLSGSAPQLTE